MASGPDNNGVYQGTTTFKGNSGSGNPNSGNSPNGNALKQYVDNSNTPNIVTGTTLEALNDGIVRWGRASGGTYNGQNMLMTSWITGTATPTLVLANLSAFYKVTNSTAPYLINNGSVTAVGTADSVSGNMYVNFSALKWGYNLSIPVPGQAFNLIVENNSLANNILGVGGSSLTAGVNKLSHDNATITGISTCGCVVAGVTGTGILPNGVNNNAVVQGALFGANAERAGLEYGINLSGSGISGGGGNLYGAVVLTKQ